MEDFEKQIKLQNVQRQLKIGQSFSGFDAFEKGKVAAEGEVRTFGGVKHRKQGKKWIPVSEGKGKSKKQDPTPRGKKKEEGEKSSEPKRNIPKQEISQLKQVKQLIDKDPTKAKEIADGLSDEAKQAIPQQAWDKMTSGGQEKSKESSASNDINEEEKSKLKQFVSKNKELFDTGEHTHPERSKAAKFIRGKAKGIVKGLKHEIHHIKEAGVGLKKLATGKKLDRAEKKAMRKVGISLGLTVGSMLLTGGTSIFAHGIGSFMSHLGIHFVEHSLLETGIMALAFAKAVEDELKKEMEGDISDEQIEKLLTRVVESFADYMESGDWSDLPEQLELDSEEK